LVSGKTLLRRGIWGQPEVKPANFKRVLEKSRFLVDLKIYQDELNLIICQKILKV